MKSGLALDVEDVLARAAAVDAEVLDALADVSSHSPRRTPVKRTLRPGPGADADGDLVEALLPALLDVDVAPERGRDRGGEVAAGELLGSLVEREVSIGDVDGLVRHVGIVSPVRRCSYT